jgi:hypothetical protein
VIDPPRSLTIFFDWSDFRTYEFCHGVVGVWFQIEDEVERDQLEVVLDVIRLTQPTSVSVKNTHILLVMALSAWSE